MYCYSISQVYVWQAIELLICQSPTFTQQLQQPEPRKYGHRQSAGLIITTKKNKHVRSHQKQCINCLQSLESLISDNKKNITTLTWQVGKKEIHHMPVLKLDLLCHYCYQLQLHALAAKPSGCASCSNHRKG